MTTVLPARPTGEEIKAAPSLSAAMHDLDRRRARSRQKKVGASEIGECRRRTAYTIAGTAKTNPPTGLQAALGTAIHKDVLRALVRSYGGMSEVKVEADHVKGSADWLDEFWIEDLKTTSSNGYARVLARGPYDKHWFQTVTYAWLMRMGYITDKRMLRVGTEQIDVEGMRIRYLSRDTGEDMVYARTYDPFLAAEATFWLADVYRVLEENNNQPEAVERDGFGPGIDSFCDYCPFLNACWGVAPTPEEDADFSVQSRLTVTDEDFAQALADYDESRTAEAEAKRRKEFARERLRGRTGVGGGLHCAWTGGNDKTSVDTEAALELLRTMDVPIPVKTTTTRRSIRVTKVPDSRRT